MASSASAKLLSSQKRSRSPTPHPNPNPNPKSAACSPSPSPKKKKKQGTDYHDSASASASASPPSSSSLFSYATNPNRVRLLKSSSVESAGTGSPVLYWMSRDQRSIDNWALLYAAEVANKKGSPLGVVFNLVDTFLGAQARQFAFMLRGLRIVEEKLRSLNIPFFLLKGEPRDNIPALLEECGASTLVVDFSPLRIAREWCESVCRRVPPCVNVYEVDAHNVVPAWIASNKLEYGARTIRPKIQKLLPEYLVEYPQLEASRVTWSASKKPQIIDWDSLVEEVTRKGGEVPEVEWCRPGEGEAMEVLVGKKNGFLTRRIKNYADDRNDPTKPSGLSGLSPYLHYGHISAQRCALEGRKLRSSHTKAIDSFLEELIIRRELADNFCLYQPHYDDLQGAYDWARTTLLEHAADKREHLFTRDQLEKARTHDELWNASQLEMVHLGKMHGFMRMYWAKKILEWTTGPEEALAIAIYLNDKYELDGRDPNGYVGCMWSICGIHDQGWKERPVFGKIRYMNYNGCKRKFNVDGYIGYVRRAVAELKKAAKRPNNITSQSS